MTSPLAVIDLGTNTARLLIGRRETDGTITHLLIKRHITRLGGGFTPERGISFEARDRNLAAMLDFAAAIRDHRVSTVRAVATSAVRDAINGPEFCASILAATGIRLEVIDGETEGKLTLRGVLAGITHHHPDLFLFDVGGGSTEYTLAREGVLLFTRSLPLGVVRLTEGKVTPRAITEKIARELAPLEGALSEIGLLPDPAATTLVATAGTATTLAAISMQMKEYDYRKINNHRLSQQEIKAIYERLLPLSPEERLRVPGMEKGREDLIIAGILITLATMNLFSFDHVTVSDFGLLEGLLVDLSDAVSPL